MNFALDSVDFKPPKNALSYNADKQVTTRADGKTVETIIVKSRMPKAGQFVTSSQTTDGGVDMNQVTRQHGKNFVQKYEFVANSAAELPKNVDA